MHACLWAQSVDPVSTRWLAFGGESIYRAMAKHKPGVVRRALPGQRLGRLSGVMKQSEPNMEPRRHGLLKPLIPGQRFAFGLELELELFFFKKRK